MPLRQIHSISRSYLMEYFIKEGLMYKNATLFVQYRAFIKYSNLNMESLFSCKNAAY
jgi:hypothetical protein